MAQAVAARKRVSSSLAWSPAACSRLARVVATAWLAAAAAIFLWRRSHGALITPPSSAQLLALGVLVACVRAAALVGLRDEAALSPWRRFVDRRRLLPLVSAVVLFWAVCLRGTPWSRVAALAAPLAIVEVASWVAARRASVSRRHAARPLEETENDDTADDQVDEPDETVSQRWTRVHTAAGVDVQSGEVRVEFAHAQRTAVAHVSFCPPFARLPRVEIECREGPKARAKVTHTLCHGARVEIKLEHVEETPTAVVLELTAECDG